MEENETSGSEPLVFIITGSVKRAESPGQYPFNALLCAADDDSAVRSCLNALAQEGYEEANLDQIGNVMDRPHEEEFQGAYDAALNGEVALIVFESGNAMD